MRERKKPGDEDDYNKTHHVYDDPLRLVQEIQNERVARQDSKKVLNIDVKKEGGKKKQAPPPPKTKPKSTRPKLWGKHGNKKASYLSNISSDNRTEPSKNILSNSKNITDEPSSATDYTNNGFMTDIEEDSTDHAGALDAAAIQSTPKNSTGILNESQTQNRQTDSVITLEREPKRLSHLQQAGALSTSASPSLTIAAPTDIQLTYATPGLITKPSTSGHLEHESPSLPSSATEQSSINESPYAELPPRRHPTQQYQETATPPEPPPPRISHEKRSKHDANIVTLGDRHSMKSGKVELGLVNPVVTSNSIRTSSTAKNIVDIIRRRKERRCFLLLITCFLFIMLVGVASVVVYLVSLQSSDDDTVQPSNLQNTDANR